MLLKLKPVLLLFAAGILSVNTVRAQVTMPVKGLCAHRGSMTLYPENTIPAFLEAIYQGAQMIEFDLQLTKDSVLVIMHDARVDRTTDGKGWVSEMTLAEIKQLDAGVKHPKHPAGVKVPTFEETLAIMPRNIWLNCHLKGGASEARMATELLVKTQRLHQAFLACSAEAARAARETDNRILICNMELQDRKDNNEYVNATLEKGAEFIQLLSGNGLPATDIIQRLKQNKVRINYFYAAEPSELKELFELGINFPLVNDVSRLMPVAESLGIVRVRPEF